MRRWLVGIVLFAGACSAPALPTPTSTPRVVVTATPRPSQPTPTSAPIPGRPAVGQEAELWAGDGTQWHLTVDEQAMDEYLSLAIARDRVGLTRLLSDEARAFPVAEGTHLLVLEQKRSPVGSLPTMKVRVLTGPQSGKEGWVDADHVRTKRQ